MQVVIVAHKDCTSSVQRMERALAASSVSVSGGPGPEVTAALVLLTREASSCREFIERVRSVTASSLEIFPLFMERFRLPDELRFLLSDRQWLDISEEGFEKVIDGIAARLHTKRNTAAEDRQEVSSSSPVRAFGDAPFVGRSKELEILQEALQEAMASCSLRCVRITGAPGVGKSRLVDRFLKSASVGFFPVLAAAAKDRQMAFVLWSRFLSDLMGDFIDAGEFVARLEAFNGAAPEAGEVEGVFSLLPLEGQGLDVLPAVSPALSDRLASMISEVLGSGFEQGRRILVLDSFQWIDQGSLSILDKVMKLVQGIPLLMILIYRPDAAVPVLPGRAADSKEIHLEPLSRMEAMELFTELSGLSPDEAKDRDLLPMEGYPLNIEILARAASPVGDESIAELIGAELRRIPEGRQSLLEALAVLGGRAPVEILAAVCGIAPPFEGDTFRTDDLAMEERNSFHRTQAFRHNTVSSALYQGIPERRRKELHLKAAIVLERFYAGDSRFSGEICGHWECAGLAEKALEHAASYLAHINTVCDSNGVINWVERIEGYIAAMGNPPERMDQLCNHLLMKEEALDRLGRTEEREELLDRIEELANRFDLHDRLGSAWISRSFIRKDQGRYDEAVELLEKAGDFLSAKDEKYRLACAVANLASVISDHRDRLREAEGLYLRSLAVFEELGNSRDIATTWLHLGILCLEEMRLEEALEYFSKAEELFTGIDFTYGRAMVLVNRANVSIKLDRNLEALEDMEGAARLFRKAGDNISLAVTLGNRANTLSRTGRMTEAFAAYREAIDLNEQCGNMRSLEKARTNFADCLRKMGDLKGSLEQLETSLRINEITGNSYWKARTLEGIGRTLAESGKSDQAVGNLLSAFEIASGKGYDLALRVKCSLALAKLGAGRPLEALQLCGEVLAGDTGEGFPMEHFEATVLKADALAACGRPEEALKTAYAAFEMADSARSAIPPFASKACLGRALTACGQVEKGFEMQADAAADARGKGYGDIYWITGPCAHAD